MAIQTPLNYNIGNDTFRFPIVKKESDMTFVMNNDGNDQFYLNLQNESQQLQHGNQNQQLMFRNFQNKQKQDIDQFIISQNERLRFLMQEHRTQQLEMIRRIEVNASALLAQKEQQIMKSLNRTTELELMLQKKAIETQSWQGLAKEREAMISYLNSRLKEQRERAKLTAAVEDEGSCCGGNGCGGEDQKKTPPCKGCGFKDSCVLLLPCRHLCCCRDCEAFLDFCPVCCSPKTGSIEVLIS